MNEAAFLGGATATETSVPVSVYLTTRNVHSSHTNTYDDVILSAVRRRAKRGGGKRRIYAFPPRYYYVYIMTNRSRTLYTGVTGNLTSRVWQHKQGTGPGFTSRYKMDRLVYYERFVDVRRAIAR